jgi:phosphoribosylanthranilate isomerase
VDIKGLIQVVGVIDQAEADMLVRCGVRYLGFPLQPGNVRAAILEVRPAGVDAHTGLEDESGRKNEAKVARSMAEAREGFRLASST